MLILRGKLRAVKDGENKKGEKFTILSIEHTTKEYGEERLKIENLRFPPLDHKNAPKLETEVNVIVDAWAQNGNISMKGVSVLL